MFNGSICDQLAAIDQIVDEIPSGGSEEDNKDSGELIREIVDDVIMTIVTNQVGQCLELKNIILETQDTVWRLMGLIDWSHPDVPSWLNDTTSDTARAISRRYAMDRI